MTEPVDTRTLWWDVTDNMYDHLGGVEHMDDDLLDWVITHIEEPVRHLICEAKGHTVIDDQCGIPAHRYCAICTERTPNAELTEPTAEEGAL
jgi:hypothetical protein